MLQSRKNIVFSTTRQWNPGDEIILFGVQAIFKSLNVSYNPLIYNRNPDIRPCFPDDQLFRTQKLPLNFHHEAERIAIEANLKVGFFDNSMKPDGDYSFVDWVVFAGTPEWCGSRLSDLYRNILKHNIPVMILGVGGGFYLHKESFREVVSKAKTLTVREGTTRSILEAEGFRPRQMPCPALLSAPKEKERAISEVKKIGLIFQTTNDLSVVWSGCSQEAFDYHLALYRAIRERYVGRYEFAIVCHYVDEIPLAKKLFPDLEVYYSYDAAEYFDIYRQFDTVIGPRVHGVGAAASVGVPGIALSHDARGSTCEGFLAALIRPNDDIEGVLRLLDNRIHTASFLNKDILRHKARTLEAYQEIVGAALKDSSVVYDNLVEPPEPLPFTFERFVEVMRAYFDAGAKKV